MSILVYADRGAESVSLRHAVRELRGALERPVGRIRADSLIKGGWEEECDLLVFPGGLDIHYHQDLKGEGCRRVRGYVENGGRYLGLCAGGYFGCSGIDFERGHQWESIEERELAFYSGTAEGSALGLGAFDPAHKGGAQVAKITADGQTYDLFYLGGCRFVGGEGETVATYADGTPAAVYCEVGRGKVLLCGVHPEYNPEYLSATDPYLAPLLPQLQAGNEGRKRFWKGMLRRLQ